MGEVEVPRLKREWIGRRVRVLEELRNGWGVIPAGHVMEVLKHGGNRRQGGAWIGGLDLQSAEPCQCCGLKARISRVEESAVELLPKDASAE